jgi:hypothetical protein
MVETTDQIKHEIALCRGELAQNINELEHRVKTTLDFRQQFHRHTGAILGAAFGGGLLLGWMSGGGRER